jgi:vacuolar-type H+-ATPase subunit E/Vma4
MIKTIDERMQALAQAVMNDAGSEAEKIKAEALQKAETIRLQAQQQAEAERKQIIDHARQQAASIKSQNVSSTKLKAQMLWIERREKMFDKIFETARQRMTDTTQWSNYNEIVHQMVEEAVGYLGAKTARIHADKITYAMLSDGMLQQIASELQLDLQLGEKLQQGTGVIAETIDGHRQFDNTLEARLHRLQDSLRSPVYHILMGETL